MGLVSVIVPAYNIRDFIGFCLDSVLSQSYPDLDIVVVDDGSTDDTGAICDAYALRDKRIRVIHQDNAGLSSARNAGLDAAKGDWVVFVDGDDFIHRQYVESLVNACGSGADIVMCSFKRVNTEFRGEEETEEPDTCLQPSQVLTGKQCLDNMFVLDGESKIPFLVVWNKLYPSHLLEGVRFDDIYGIEDQPFNARVYQKAGEVAVLQVPLYYYRFRNGSITEGFSSKLWHYQVKGLASMLSIIPESEKLVRGHLLKRIYKKILTSRYFLRGTEYAAGTEAFSRSCVKDTYKEYVSAPGVSLIDRLLFYTLWACPPLMNMFMCFSGNKR